MSDVQNEKISTLNVGGRQGVTILKRRYDVMKNSILRVIGDDSEVTLAELGALVNQDIGGSFDGKIGWYLMAVKLDLEAKGVLVRVPKKSPQTLRIAK